MHIVEADVRVPARVTLTLPEGIVAKVLPGRSLAVATGGTLAAVATNGLPVVFTSVRDDARRPGGRGVARFGRRVGRLDGQFDALPVTG